MKNDRQKDMPTSGIAKKIYAIAEPLAEQYGVILWDVEFKKEGSEWYLIIYIHKDGGVEIIDCENMSRAISPILDELDFIEQSYRLQVSSLGLNRHLHLQKDFDLFMNSDVEVKFFKALESGEKELTGELIDFDNGIVTIKKITGDNITFNMKDTAYIRPEVKF